jgi:hypothetical protein
VPGSTAPGEAASTTTAVGGTPTDGSTTPGSSSDDADPERIVAGALGNESATGPPPAGGTAQPAGERSALPSVIGFGVALSLVAGAALLVRRRRRTLVSTDSPTPAG